MRNTVKTTLLMLTFLVTSCGYLHFDEKGLKNDIKNASLHELYELQAEINKAIKNLENIEIK